MSIQSLSEIDLKTMVQARNYHPSPTNWVDQVFYFLLPDRFSNDHERNYKDIAGNVVTHGSIEKIDRKNDFNSILHTGNPQDAQNWELAGEEWVGGKITGITSKIGYLKRMGVTTIWVGPIFKQVEFEETYHGYGIQNFLEVDPHFGTMDELKDMIKTAHNNGIYVFMDVIINHTGNVFGYKPDRYWTEDEHGNLYLDPRWDGQNYQVEGFNDHSGTASIPFNNSPTASDMKDAVWPLEFQNPEFYTQKGHISNYDYYPEFVEGDFKRLKDLYLRAGQTEQVELSEIDNYQPSDAMKALCKVYKYWIAETDCDGFRIDTVKHMDKGAVRYFTSVIHEFAQSIGKDNFYLVGEITGPLSYAYHIMQVTGINAAIGLADVQGKMEATVKGECSPNEYFSLFRNSLLVDKESHTWFRDKVLTMFDDHDKVRQRPVKSRFCAFEDQSIVAPLVFNALALNLTTLGIPCIYYGSEQAADGEGGDDRYIREAMFGGKFGFFRSTDHHCFDEDYWVYQELAELTKIRSRFKALSRGRQYLREISGNGSDFGYPLKYGDKLKSIVAWSRILADEEIVAAINTDMYQPTHAWVTIDNDLHQAGDRLTCLYCSTDKSRIGEKIDIVSKNGKAIELTMPAGGFALFRKV